MFGGRRRALEAADAQAQAEEEEGRALRVSLLAELASSYVALRSAQERQRIALDTVASLETARRLAQTRYERGLGSAVEAAQARASWNWAGPPAGAARGAGSAGACDRRVDGRLSRRTEGRAGARSGAHARAAAPAVRPAFRDAAQPARHTGLERRLAAATARVGVAVAERFPRFVIPLDLGSAASLVSDLFSRASVAWSVGAGASQSLYNGGRAEAGQRAAQAGAQAQRLAYEHSVRRAFQDVEDALAGLNAERERQAHLSAAVRDSLAAQDRATRLYRSGLIGYLPVLAAQQATYRARDELALNALARSRHAIGLYKALGAGWEAQAAPASGADGG